MTPDVIKTAADEAFGANPGPDLRPGVLADIRRLVGPQASTEDGNAA